MRKGSLQPVLAYKKATQVSVVLGQLIYTQMNFRFKYMLVQSRNVCKH